MQVKFKNEQNQSISGVLHIPETKTENAVIVCHGFASTKDRPRLVKLCDAFAQAGFSALRFDFGGCGESYATPITVAGEVNDLKCARMYLNSQVYKSLAVVAESLGGLVALEGYDSEIKTMVLWAPVTKGKTPSIFKSEPYLKELKEKGVVVYHKQGRDYIIPRQYLQEREAVDQKKLLEPVKCPILILHGSNDTSVPLSHSQEAAKYLNARLQIIDGAEHSLDSAMDKVIPITVDWIKENM